MSLIEVKGDLITMFEEHQFDVIAHGCNTKNLMGAGIARTIRQHFPNVFVVDKNFPIPLGRKRLGDYSICKTDYGFILNFYTQENIYNRPNGEIPFEEDALIHIEPNSKIKIMLNQFRNIDINNVSEYISFKTKVVEFIAYILD